MSPYHSIAPVINAMSPEERGLLHLVLCFGDSLKQKYGESLSDPKFLAKWNCNAAEITNLFKASFQEGIGLWDEIAGRDNDYGKQLDWVISKVLVKSLKLAHPIFNEPEHTGSGALLRERWICEKLLEAMWDKLPEDAKRELAKEIGALLQKAGVDKAKAAKTIETITLGGLTAAKAILGFQFHILLAQLSNLLFRSLVGRGLSLAANAALQRFAGLFFGPVGWVITILLLIPTITGLIFPRGCHQLRRITEAAR